MSTTCNPCEAFTCTEPVPTCINSLNLGEIPGAASTEAIIYVQYNIGGDEVITSQQVTLNGQDEAVLDMTTPNKDYYNQYIGIYKIWVTDNDTTPDVRLEMIRETITSELYGVTFQKVEGFSQNLVNITPIV